MLYEETSQSERLMRHIASWSSLSAVLIFVGPTFAGNSPAHESDASLTAVSLANAYVPALVLKNPQPHTERVRIERVPLTCSTSLSEIDPCTVSLTEQVNKSGLQAIQGHEFQHARGCQLQPLCHVLRQGRYSQRARGPRGQEELVRERPRHLFHGEHGGDGYVHANGGRRDDAGHCDGDGYYNYSASTRANRIGYTGLLDTECRSQCVILENVHAREQRAGQHDDRVHAHVHRIRYCERLHPSIRHGPVSTGRIEQYQYRIHRIGNCGNDRKAGAQGLEHGRHDGAR